MPSAPNTGGAKSAKGAQGSQDLGKGKEPSLIVQFGSLAVKDETGVKVKVEASGTYSSDPAKAKEAKGFSPGTERHQAVTFVKGDSGLDDPFGTPARTVRVVTGKRRAMSDNWRSGSSSDSNGSSSPHGKAESAPGSIPTASANVERAVVNVPDNTLASQPIVTNQDAQNQFPIECCIFVANLLQSESEDNLQASLTRVFRQYGPVWVNVKRDKNKMPFAFCTFSLPEHAQRAISDAHGRYINGRPCRCEQARGHREYFDSYSATGETKIIGAGFFFLGRRFGSVITHDEATDLLSPYGEIKSCRTATDIDRACFNLNEGVLVEFAMYPHGQAALAAFRNHNVYKMLDLADIDSPVRRRVHATTSTSQARAYNTAYEHERSTAFVGSLPSDITEEQLEELFGEYGTIEEITIRECNSKYNADQKLCLAFVKYTSPVAVSQAIEGKNGFAMGSNRLRVAPKNSDRNPRTSPQSASRFHSTPARGEPPMSSTAQMTPSPQDTYPSGYAHQQALPTAAPIYGQPHGSYPAGYAVTPQHSSYGYPVQQPAPIYGGQYFDGSQYYTGGVPTYGTPISPFYYQSNPGYPGIHQYQYSPYGAPVAQQNMVSPPVSQYQSEYLATGNSDQDDGSTTPTRHGHAAHASGSDFQSH